MKVGLACPPAAWCLLYSLPIWRGREREDTGEDLTLPALDPTSDDDDDEDDDEDDDDDDDEARLLLSNTARATAANRLEGNTKK